jgi:hypothetical protein
MWPFESSRPRTHDTFSTPPGNDIEEVECYACCTITSLQMVPGSWAVVVTCMALPTIIMGTSAELALSDAS